MGEAMRRHKQEHYADGYKAYAYDMKEFITNMPMTMCGFKQTMQIIASGAHVKIGFYWGAEAGFKDDFYKVLFLSDNTRVHIEAIDSPPKFKVRWDYR